MKYYKQKIRKFRSKEELPRERLAYHGVCSLSDRELLSLILGSGVRGKNVHTLASSVLQLLDKEQYSVSLEKLRKLHGLGHAKACLVLAVLEFGRRITAPKHYKIEHPNNALSAISHFADRKQEYFLCISLNGAHEIISTRVISIGLVNQTLVHPREVFADALMERAAAIIVAHNHPSGNVQPSQEDAIVTRRLVQAGTTLGINLLDHIIFSPGKYYSFCEEGKL